MDNSFWLDDKKRNCIKYVWINLCRNTIHDKCREAHLITYDWISYQMSLDKVREYWKKALSLQHGQLIVNGVVKWTLFRANKRNFI